MAAVTVAELLIEIGVDASDAEKASKRLEDQLKKTGGGAKKLGDDVSKAEARLAKFGDISRKVADGLGSLFKKVAAAGVGLGAAVLKVGSDFETLEARLRTATGSADGAAKALGFVTEFAQKVPFQVQEITDSFIKLEGAGLKPTEERLRAFSDIAAGNAKSLNQLTEAALDAAQGEFERLKEFNIRGAKEGDQVALTFKGVTTRVENSSEAITQFLQTLGEEIFSGASAERMNTLSGVISNAKDQFALFLNEVAKDGPIEAFKELIDALVKNIGGPNGLAKKISKALTGAIKTMTQAVESGALVVLGKLVDILLLLIENWDVLLGLFAGAKTAQAFAAVATGFSSMGVAAAGALGPIGAIGGALLALLPIANRVGNELSDILFKDRSIRARRQTGAGLLELTATEKARLEQLSAEIEAAGPESDRGRELSFERNRIIARSEGRAKGAKQARDFAAQAKAETEAEIAKLVDAGFTREQADQMLLEGGIDAKASDFISEEFGHEVPMDAMGPEFVPEAFAAPKSGRSGRARGAKPAGRTPITSPVTIREFFDAAAQGDLGNMAARTPRAEAIEPTVAITINNTTNNFENSFNIKGADGQAIARNVLSEFNKNYQSKMTQAGQQMGPPTLVR